MTIGSPGIFQRPTRTFNPSFFKACSRHAYGDYDEASMFSYAAGKVIESFYRFNLTENDKVIYQAHEWMTGMGEKYI